MTKRKTKGKPNKIDLAIGVNIARLRRLRGYSQERLGKEVGVTFQQIQKYESGRNRVSVSRLCLIAEVLEFRLAAFVPDRFASIASKSGHQTSLEKASSFKTSQPFFKRHARG